MQKKRTLRLSLALAISSLAFQGAVHGFAKEYCQVAFITGDNKRFLIYAYESMTPRWILKKSDINLNSDSDLFRINTINGNRTSIDITHTSTAPYLDKTIKKLCDEKGTMETGKAPYLQTLAQWEADNKQPDKGDFLAGPAGLISTWTLHEIEEDGKIPNFTLYYVGWGVQALALVGVVGFVGWTIFKKKYASQSQPRTGSEVKKEEAKAEEAQ